MGVQLGIWNRNGMPADPLYLDQGRAFLSAYGPDGASSHHALGMTLLHCAFHTTAESRTEILPLITRSGCVLIWDGRLDNRRELTEVLAGALAGAASDAAIVAAAYERWGTHCFERLLGDWALSLWNPTDRSLLLAKDFLGSRPLYYTMHPHGWAWCSVLEPLLLLPDRQVSLDEECLAGWLGSFPAAHLTPYSGIQAVPPSSYALLKEGNVTVRKYWDFDPSRKIQCRCDQEYEDSFRQVFFQSVERRLRTDSPVLAELSGGMDSSSIVCVADRLLREGRADTPRLDTLSYYDDEESSWNERPFFEKVEQQRGRAGCHVDIGRRDLFHLEFGLDSFRPSPAAAIASLKVRPAYAQFLASQGSRVVLSGTGGDEVLGGVPTPLPELRDLLVRARLRRLAKGVTTWAIAQKKPWMHLFGEVLEGFLPRSLHHTPAYRRPAPWLDPRFVRRHRRALEGYPSSRIRFSGPTPTFQENLATLEALRRQLGANVLPANPSYEKRYPCLDRDLLAYLYAIPREQLVRPGQRRSLLRRALAGIVPVEILGRKRKAFVARAPLVAIANEWAELQKLGADMLLASLGVVQPKLFREALHAARQGRDVSTVALLRTIAIELWLRNLAHYGFCRVADNGIASPASTPTRTVIATTNSFSAEKNC